MTRDAPVGCLEPVRFENHLKVSPREGSYRAVSVRQRPQDYDARPRPRPVRRHFLAWFSCRIPAPSPVAVSRLPPRQVQDAPRTHGRRRRVAEGIGTRTGNPIRFRHAPAEGQRPEPSSWPFRVACLSPASTLGNLRQVQPTPPPTRYAPVGTTNGPGGKVAHGPRSGRATDSPGPFMGLPGFHEVVALTAPAPVPP
jgi:hypothetical protein